MTGPRGVALDGRACRMRSEPGGLRESRDGRWETRPATRRRSAAYVGRRRWDSGRRGRRPGDERGHGRPAGVRGSPAAGRQFGRRAAAAEGRADLALAVVEAFPDALPGPVAAAGQSAARLAARMPPATACWRNCHRARGGQAEASDFVGEPDAEGAPAAGSCVAVAAKDPPGAEGLSLGAALVKAVQEAVANQRADDLAVRTGRQLEPFGNGVPFLVVARKPALLAHGTMPPRKIVIVPARGGAG